MGKPKAPTPTDPKETASAQTAQNISTAITQQHMNNVNQVTPDGSLTYEQTGTVQHVDPNDPSKIYDIPTYTATQTLSENQQAIKDNNDQAGINLSQLAVNASGQLGDLLSNPLDVSNVPGRRNYDGIARPNLQGYGNAPSLSANLGDIPGIQTNAAKGQIQGGVRQPGRYATGVFSGGLQTGIGSTGTQNGALNDAGQIQRDVNVNQIGGIPGVTGSSAPTLSYTRSDLGGVQSNVQTGQFRGDVGDAGQIQGIGSLPGIRDVTNGPDASVSYNRSDLRQGDIVSNIGNVRDVVYGFGNAGPITKTYSGDFSQERDEVEQALMDRMNPQLSRDKEALEARLASQGLRIGSEAYQDAMDDYNRGSNDARLGAILNAGQEQSRLVGMERDRAMFENNAQQQDFAQKYQRAAFANDAQRSAFDQAERRAGFTNAAQAQRAGQLLEQDRNDLSAQTTTANLNAQNQRLGIDRDIATINARQSAVDLNNRAQAQQYGQNRDRLDAFNDAQTRQFQQNLQSGQFANAAQAQRAGQTLQQDQMGLDAQRSQGQMQLQADANNTTASRANADIEMQRQTANNDLGFRGGQFANAAQQQAHQQALSSGQFGNEASTQQMMNEIAAANFGNQARGQGFDQRMANANLRNSSLDSMFSNALQAGQFANQAQAQDFGQNISLADLNNRGAGQVFSQNLAQRSLANDTAQQDFQNRQTITDQANQNALADYQTQLSEVARDNALRDEMLQEQVNLRNQPINEIAALLSGSQVSNPNFVNPNSAQLANVDVAGIMANYDAQRQQQYQAQMGQWNNTMGGLLGFGGSVLMSDRRLKRDIRKVRGGTLPVYEYRYAWDTPGTVRRGYMAQDVLRVIPDAVHRVVGWLALDYSKLPEVA